MSDEENKVSKSKLVCELLDKNPSLKPMDIVKIMGEQGVKINNRYVSIIKNKHKKGGKKISLAKRRMNSSKSYENLGVDDMLSVKSLYDSIGADRIVAAVRALEQIVG
jgi:hypothetical protein